MNHPLKLSLLVALALGSTQLMAVDFGQIRVKSSLGQPLVAEIPLSGATSAELQGMRAEQASNDEYARAGITTGRSRVPLSFSVVQGQGGQHLIRITSTAAVEDPYVDLLLDVNTPKGRSVHEFAILLDPPGQAAVAAAPAPAAPAVAPPRAARPAAAPAPRPAAAAPAKAAAAAQPAASAANGKFGPVQRGQTLSGIAQQTMPAGVDLSQMLLALKQANPEAFYRDNINTLKAGAVLRIPTASEAQAVQVAAAIAEVRRQNSAWRGAAAEAPAAVADTATRAPAAASPSGAGAPSGDRLALLAAKDDAQASGGAAGGSNAGASAAELRKSLMQTRESLASVQQQAADLKSRLQEITDINNKSTKLLALKDSEIAELQAKLAAARKGGTAAVADAATPAAAAAPAAQPAKSSTAPAREAVASAVVAAGSSASPAMATSAVAATAAKPAATNAKPAAAKPSPPAAPAAGPWYMQTWAWLAAGGAVVLLILLGLLGRQRKRPAPSRGRTAPSLAESFGAPVAGSDGDVDQDELLDQLAQNPDDIDLNLRLVTLYYSRRDVEHFEAAAEAMHAHIQDPSQDEWQDVVHMGEDLVPEHPLFSHHESTQAADAEPPVEEFNIDDYEDDVTAAKATAAALEGVAIPGELADGAPAVARADIAARSAGSADDWNTLDRSAPALDPAPSPVAVEAVPVSPEAEDGSAAASAADDHAVTLEGFSDDPIDTKLDLARAYVDMGDEEGARAMLDEVMQEGSQMQKDVATGLLAGLKR